MLKEDMLKLIKQRETEGIELKSSLSKLEETVEAISGFSNTTGGTALKKCYFGEYRFSEDLDFTARDSAPRQDELEKEINRSCRLATELVQSFSLFELEVERYRERTNVVSPYDLHLLCFTRIRLLYTKIHARTKTRAII